MQPKHWTVFILLGAIWSASFLWIKIALNEIGPLTLVAYRVGFGLLTGLAVALVMLSVLAMVMLISIKPLNEVGPSADDTALVNLLVTWYRIGPLERGALLEKLDASDVDTNSLTRRMLYLEHRDLEQMDDNG